MIMRNVLKTAPVLLALFLSLPLSLPAQVAERTLEAEGMAAGSDLKARDEAIQRALRRAIEQGVGTLVDSETMVENFKLLDDKIYSDVKGYVKNYEILSDNKGEGGVYRIKIRATVALARLEKNLKALNIIRDRKGNPRVMVVFRETVDGVLQPGRVAATEAEKKFLSLNFPLVDSSQMERVKERDVVLAQADPQKAAALGQRFGAEVVVTGESTSDFVEETRPYGVTTTSYYGAQISAKAVRTDTAQVIASDSVAIQRVGGGGRIPTAKKALRQAGERLADAMARQIVERWRGEVFNRVDIQIVAEGATASRRKALKGALADIRGVSAVNERSWTNGVLVLDVTVDGAIWKNFEERLEELPGVKVAVTGKTQNRIDCRLEDAGRASMTPGLMPGLGVPGRTPTTTGRPSGLLSPGGAPSTQGLPPETETTGEGASTQGLPPELRFPGE